MSELFSNIDYGKFYNEVWEEKKLREEIMGNKEDNLDSKKEKEDLKKKLEEKIQKRNQKEK